MKRSAPKDGYDFGNKRQYRRDVWATAKRWLRAAYRGLPATFRGDQNALMLPSAEAAEVSVALRNGFNEKRLHLVDRNPAIAAHLKRRFPEATCYGVDVIRAAERIVKGGGWIDVANLDLCCPSDHAAKVAQAFVETGVLSYQALVFVTFLRGREQSLGKLVAFADSCAVRLGDLEEKDSARHLSIINALGKSHGNSYVGFARAGCYRSSAGSQTMGWGAYLVAKKETSLGLLRLSEISEDMGLA